MLLIKKQLIAKVREALQAAHLHQMLDGAVTLELATLPPYLTGAFSLKPGANEEARILVQSVALQEMLHMALAANTLIAIGGGPKILANGLALRYPGPLPMSVDEGLTVRLGSLTKRQVHDVFMGIERPDTGAILPGETELHPLVLLRQREDVESIGEFYTAILQTLERLVAHGNDPFADPRLDRQVDLSRWFPGEIQEHPSGKVHDMKTARIALETIIRQGEGAQIGEDPINPIGGPGDALAHFFKFGEIYYGKRLVRDVDAPSGWSYSGAPVPFDSSQVYEFPDNAALSSYPPGSAAAVAAEQFYEAYVRLLTALDHTFNGAPAQLDAALGIMYELRLIAQKVIMHPANPSEPDGPVAAPPFQPAPATA